MQRYLQLGGTVLGLLVVSACLIAQEAKPVAKPAVVSQPVEGELKLGDKSFKLGHIVAYESKFNDDTMITLLMSDRKLPANEIKAALAEGKGSDESLSLSQPHLKIVFKKSGEVAWFNAVAGGTTVSSTKDVKGEFKLNEGRIIGHATLPPTGEGALKRSFDVKYDVALGVDQAPKPAPRPAGPVKPTVTGTFKGNGKLAKLAFVSARRGEPFADKPSLMLVFTEKDHSKDPKPDFKAGFGDYGSALIISLHENGSIFGCEVSHSALEKRPFSSVGAISTSEFDLGDGQVSGEIKTDGEEEFFGDKWEVDIKFAAPFAATSKPAVAAVQPTPKKNKKPEQKPTDPSTKEKPANDIPESDKPAEPAGKTLNVYDLALPKDVSDFEYKKLVQHLAFSSSLDVQALVKMLTKSLADQGWKTDGSDLVTPKSSILKRQRGEAELTIFVKPADKGSRVTMFTKGLDWTQKKVEKDPKAD